MSKRASAAIASGLGVVALTATYLTVPWEGVKNTAYWDSIGRVWTVCAGETKGVKKGDTYTHDQCMNMLFERMERDYHQPLQKCIRGFDNMPVGVQASFLDLSWNVGVGGVCHSTAARRAAAGNWTGACEAMTWFNKAGGQVIRGLDLRRKEGDSKRIGDRELCLAGIDAPKPPIATPIPTPRPDPVVPPPAAAPDPEPPVHWWTWIFRFVWGAS